MKKRNNIEKGGSIILITVIVTMSTFMVTAYTDQSNLADTFSPYYGMVWDNGLQYHGYVPAQWDEVRNFDAYPADDFQFQDDTTVRYVNWVGGYFNTNYQQGNLDWSLAFYQDSGDGNIPGALYAGPYQFTPTMCNPVLLEDTGSNTYYQYSVELPEDVEFIGGEKYWISSWGVGTYPPQTAAAGHNDSILLHQAVYKSDYFGYSDWTDGEDVSWIGVPSDACFQLITPSLEVPVWEVGDTWTYETHIYMAASENVTDDMVYDGTDELVLTVIDDTGDTYKLEGMMEPLTGTLTIPGNIGYKVTQFSSYKCSLEMRKTDLALIQHELTMTAVVLPTIGNFPIPLPIQIKLYRKTVFEPECHMLPFPLFDEKTEMMPRITLNEEFDLSMFWGLVPMDSGNTDEGWLGEAPFSCNMETSTVAAGTFDVFNITCEPHFNDIAYDKYVSHYAEDAGNIIYGSYNIDYKTGNTYFLIEFALKSTTYQK